MNLTRQLWKRKEERESERSCCMIGFALNVRFYDVDATKSLRWLNDCTEEPKVWEVSDVSKLPISQV